MPHPNKCFRDVKIHRTDIKGGLQSKALNMIYVIDSSWLTDESPERKPDLLGISSSCDARCEYRESHMSFSRIFPKIGSKEIGRLVIVIEHIS